MKSLKPILKTEGKALAQKSFLLRLTKCTGNMLSMIHKNVQNLKQSFKISTDLGLGDGVSVSRRLEFLTIFSFLVWQRLLPKEYTPKDSAVSANEKVHPIYRQACFETAQVNCWEKYGQKLFPNNCKLLKKTDKCIEDILKKFWQLKVGNRRSGKNSTDGGADGGGGEGGPY